MPQYDDGWHRTMVEKLGYVFCRPCITALTMVRGVLSVTPVPANIDQHIGQERADARWRTKLVELIRGEG